MGLLHTVRFVLDHPLNREDRPGAFLRWMRWQLGSRILPGPVAVPFVNDTVLLVTPGMTGATGNVYCGLHELDDMALVLHALRPGDLFVDIGANIGSYTMLAAGGVGAACLSFEPVPATFEWLRKNTTINRLENCAEILNIGLGDADGELFFTESHDSMNHVARTEEEKTRGRKVQVRRLDAVLDGRTPFMIKVDVEGYESAVMNGAAAALANQHLRVVIMELNGQGAEYGADEAALHELMLGQGFEVYRYDAISRCLTPRTPGKGPQSISDNSIYIRDLEVVKARLRSAPRFRLGTGVLI